jgi:hypothetical protein
MLRRNDPGTTKEERILPKHDHHLPGEAQRQPPERNNPRKSEIITTGTYKTEETRKEQIARHEDPDKVAQHAVPPHEGPHGDLARKADSILQEHLGEHRDGSDSNAHHGRKQSHLHEDHRDWNTPQSPTAPDPAVFDHELRPHDAAGVIPGKPRPYDEEVAAAEIKDLCVRFAQALTPQQLHELVVLPARSRLEQGTHYLDLVNLAAGELVAMGGMEVQPDHYYVAKNDTEYALWDTLKTLPQGAQASDTPPRAAVIAPAALATNVDE